MGTGAQWPDGWGHQAAARGRRSCRLHRSSIGTLRRQSGSRAPGRTTGEHGAWSSLGGVARKALGAVLPMSLTTLKALTWDLVCFAVPTSQVELVWKAVQARHRQFHLPPPMCEANQF
jgi:hypothetical protein